MPKAKNRAVEYLNSWTGENTKLLSTVPLSTVQRNMSHRQKAMADPNNIREMEETDLERVCEIWLKWVKKTAPPLKSGESWKSKLPNLKSEAQDSKNQKYVYEEDRIIKGFIIAGVLNGSPYLYELYVDSQGKGIGIILLDKIRKIYRYLNSHIYECNPYLKFYLKHGFEVCKKRPCCDTGENKLIIRW